MKPATIWADVPGGWTVCVEAGLVEFRLDFDEGSVHVEQEWSDDWTWTVCFGYRDRVETGTAPNAQDAAIEAWGVVQRAEALAEATEADMKGW